MRMRQRFISIAAVGTAAMLALTACGGGNGDDEEELAQGFEDCLEDPNNCNGGERGEGGEIIWTLDQKPTGFFTMTPQGGSVYTLQAIQGILPYTGQFLPDGEYQHNLDLLVGPPEIVNQDPLQTEWHIRPEAVWDDGTPVTADDVIVTWKMSTKESDGHCVGCSPRAVEERIANIEGSDDGKIYTITYKDGVPDPEWFAYGSAHGIAGGFVPAHLAAQNGFDVNDPEELGQYFQWLHENAPTFSAGPYLIEEWVQDEHIIKVPNPRWYGEVQPTLERIVLQFLREENWVQAIRNGELHAGSPAGWAPDVIEQMLELENLRLFRQTGPSWEHLDFNMDNEWLGGDVELRRAIFTAIDRQDTADRIYSDLFPEIALRGNYTQGTTSNFYVDHLEGTGQGTGDLDMARQILRDAGYEGFEEGEGPLTLDGEQVGPFRLRATAAPAREASLQLIQGYLAQIGIGVNIEHTDDLGKTLGSQDYDIIQFGWSGSPLFINNGLQLFQSDSNSNFGKYSNPEVDALIERQQSEAATLAESAELHDQMAEIVVQDAYVLPLYDTPVYIFVTDDYVGVRDDTYTSLRGLYETQQWGVVAQ